jgi:hypothetical protein
MRLVEISIISIKVLCTICTVRTNRFYVPGESNISERLRKKSFDLGLFTLLQQIYIRIKDNNSYF